MHAACPRVRRHLIGPERRLIHQPRTDPAPAFCCPCFFLPLLWSVEEETSPRHGATILAFVKLPLGLSRYWGEVCLRSLPLPASTTTTFWPSVQSCQFSTKLLRPAAYRPIIEHANKVLRNRCSSGEFGTLQYNLELLSSADGARMGHEMRSRSFQGDHGKAALERRGRGELVLETFGNLRTVPW